MSRPIPGFLRKRGIKTLTDNVPEGHQVRVPARLFFTLFEDEIIKATKPASSPADSPNEPVPVTQWSIDYGNLPNIEHR